VGLSVVAVLKLPVGVAEKSSGAVVVLDWPAMLLRSAYKPVLGRLDEAQRQCFAASASRAPLVLAKC
jgi:hypothetical protein